MGRNIKGYNHFGNTLWQFLIKLNMHLHIHPAISILGLYPRDIKTYVRELMGTRMHHIFIPNNQKIGKKTKNQISTGY